MLFFCRLFGKHLGVVIQNTKGQVDPLEAKVAPFNVDNIASFSFLPVPIHLNLLTPGGPISRNIGLYFLGCIKGTEACHDVHIVVNLGFQLSVH